LRPRGLQIGETSFILKKRLRVRDTAISLYRIFQTSRIPVSRGTQPHTSETLVCDNRFPIFRETRFTDFNKIFGSELLIKN